MFARANTTKRSEVGTRIQRECRIDNSRKQLKPTSRIADSQSRKPDSSSKSCSLKKPAAAAGAPSESPLKGKSNVSKGTRPCAANADQNPRTWFEVLLKSPEKCRPEKILRTNNRADVKVPCRCERTNDVEVVKENLAPRSENTKRLNLIFDVLCDKIGDASDKDFLNVLNAVRILLDNPAQSRSDLRNPFGVNQLTDDDKNKFPKPAKTDGKSSNSSDLVLLRALLKETKVQKEMLQSLTVQMSQLREENKMLNQLKDARLTLEAKLISYNTEMKQLQKEQEKLKRLLELRDKEIEDLRRLVAVLKVASNNENADHSMGAIATPPSCSMSFEMPIRPASSSPTDEILHKRTPTVRRKNSVSKSIQFENHEVRPAVKENRPRESANNENMLQEVKDDVNRFLEVLESDMAELNTHDASLNLSDVTYKWSV